MAGRDQKVQSLENAPADSTNAGLCNRDFGTSRCQHSNKFEYLSVSLSSDEATNDSGLDRHLTAISKDTLSPREGSQRTR